MQAVTYSDLAVLRKDHIVQVCHDHPEQADFISEVSELRRHNGVQKIGNTNIYDIIC